MQLFTTHLGQPSRLCLDDPLHCLHVVYCADADYAVPLLASLNSVIQNCHNSSALFFHLYVPQDMVPSLVADLETFVGEAQVDVVGVTGDTISPLVKVWQGMPMHSNVFNHLRYYLPDLLPQIEHVVYLDPDTVVQVDLFEMRADYFKLLDQEARGEPTAGRPKKFLAAVPSYARPSYRATYAFLLNFTHPAVRDAVADKTKEFFNAGVFITDLAEWRRTNVTGRIEHWLAENTRTPLWLWGSQAPLALVFYDRWLPLAYEWNYRNAHNLKRKNTAFAKYMQPRLRRMKVLHFAGKTKPWGARGGHMWHLWCPHYPPTAARQFWFCKAAPRSPLDFRLPVVALRS